jgi:ribose transport system substrate-binding protein
MGKKPLIGLVMKSLQIEFFQEMNRGALEYAKDQDQFELIVVGTATQEEIGLQIELVESLITQNVDAIIIAPIDSSALVPVVAKAIKAGVKVINIDVKLDDELLRQHGVDLTYVSVDNELAAKMVGDVLASELQTGDKVIIIEGLNEAHNALQRKRGFAQSIKEYKLNLVASEAADWDMEKAERIFERLFAKHPDVKGVLCSNDPMAKGVINVLEKHDKVGEILVTGFNNGASIQPLLNSGAMLATIDPYCSQMAVRGIEYALKVLDGMDNNGCYFTDFILI